ncbi:MAG: damage-inducible protein DinB [Bacteroidetes bacterium RIFCSPHIGHO2_02_FULL_44_7]|nr:MAG: damage-inducible protein DinB [Bacteroidetes bacterium RIFCSPHIGHO2_02_FULL_44_7]
MKATDIQETEYHPYYNGYIQSAGDVDLLEGLEDEMDTLTAFFASLPTEKLDYRYAEEKWTIPEILAHLIDAERIFAYLALRFARKDATPLAGFDENTYVPESRANERSIEALVAEFRAVRMATVTLFESFNREQLERSGLANGAEMSVRAIGFVIIGHAAHHCAVIEERYV